MWKYSFAEEIENVGVENIRIESIYASDLDENHGKHAVEVRRVKNGWIRQLTARFFWQGAVSLRTYTSFFTVEDCAASDPKGTLSGGRRYPFLMDDSYLCLFQRCAAADFRHTFAAGSRTSGPYVFVDGLALTAYNDIGKRRNRLSFCLALAAGRLTYCYCCCCCDNTGPHHRFSTGGLYDNLFTNIHPLDDNDNGGEMNVQNRGPSGSGHGWAGVQMMFWNSNATRWRVHAANGAMSWAIGMVGEIGDRDTREPEPDGIFQSIGTFVTPRSLYYAQLEDRLGPNALHSVALPSQRTGTIWDELDTWMGDGLFGDAVVAWYNEEAGPIEAGVALDIGGMVRDLNLLGSAPTYAWTMSAGPSTVMFGDSAQLDTTVIFDGPGIFTLSLTVTSSDLTTSKTADLIVQVNSASPTTSTTTTTAAPPTTTTVQTTTTVAPPSSNCPKNCTELGFTLDAAGSTVDSLDVCGSSTSDGSTCLSSGVTWQMAQDECQSLGARLCTKEEIEAGETAQTGCGYDNSLIWTSSECGAGMYWTPRGDGATMFTVCTAAADDTKTVRCCGDVTAQACNPVTTTTMAPPPTTSKYRYKLSSHLIHN